MALFVPSVGETKFLEFALGVNAPSAISCHLYSNNVVPGDDDVVATYTEMAAGSYVSTLIQPADWTLVFRSKKAEARGVQQIFSFDISANIIAYGYYLVDSASGVLLAAERFSQPKSLLYKGDRVIVTPKITFRSG